MCAAFSRMDMATGLVCQGDAIAIRDHVRIEFQFVAESPEQPSKTCTNR